MLKYLFFFFSVFLLNQSKGQQAFYKDSIYSYSGYWIVPICDNKSTNFCFTKDGGNPLDPFLSVYLSKDSTGKIMDTTLSIGYTVSSRFDSLMKNKAFTSKLLKSNWPLFSNQNKNKNANTYLIKLRLHIKYLGTNNVYLPVSKKKLKTKKFRHNEFLIEKFEFL